MAATWHNTSCSIQRINSGRNPSAAIKHQRYANIGLVLCLPMCDNAMFQHPMPNDSCFSVPKNGLQLGYEKAQTACRGWGLFLVL